VQQFALNVTGHHARCPMHHHRIKHETFYLVKGTVEMEAEGEVAIMKQGDIRVMTQNTPHRFTGLKDSLILECSKPDIMSDSIFEDERITATLVAAGGEESF
jgi:quercetin dioxygenase-like cupin family protein